MKAILAYGDSLTWGRDPARRGKRHPASHRWPDVLQKELGAGHTVISEGLRGRTTTFSLSQADCEINGASFLPTALYTHAPLDLVILMLGTNDLQSIICGRAIGAMQGMRRLVEIVRQHAPRLLPDAPAPRVLVVAPPRLVKSEDPYFLEVFDEAIGESEKLASLYASLSRDLGCAFFDAAQVAHADRADGVHLDAQNTAAIGAAIAPVVRELLAH
jgi:lysophospholipase L1-like esterase